MPELNANQQKLQAFLARPDVPEEAKRKAVALYDRTPGAIVRREFPRPTATGFDAQVRRELLLPDPSPDPQTFMRALPATAGAMKFGQLGYEGGEVIAPGFGPFAPVVPYATAALGAGIGAGLGELGLAGGQRALGVPEGQAPIVPRAVQAGETAAEAELIGRPGGDVLHAGLSRIGQAGEALRSRLGIAGKYDIPIGAGEERAEAYARRLGARGVVTRAAQRQSSAIADAGERVVQQFGGKLDTATFAANARRSIRQTIKNFPGLKVAGASYRQEAEALLGRTIREAKVADALAKDPNGLAVLMRQTGGQGLQDLQRSWLTSVLEGATGKTGLRKGLINPLAATDAWDALGQVGQQRLFGPLATDVGGFFDALRQAEVSRVGGKEGRKLSWSLLQKALGLVTGGGLVESFHGGGGLVASGVAGAAAIAQPWIAAQLLTRPGGAKIVAAAFGGPGMRTVAQMTPAVVRGAAQFGGQLANPPPDVPDHVQVPSSLSPHASRLGQPSASEPRMPERDDTDVVSAARSTFGYPIRESDASERRYFRSHPDVAGMATDDNAIILNPFSTLDPGQRAAVARNEAVRLWLTQNRINPSFRVTPEQQKLFAGYGSLLDVKHTILGRIISDDPSAGTITPEQHLWAARVRAQLDRRAASATPPQVPDHVQVPP